MAGRLARKRLIVSALESNYAEDADPDGSDAILVQSLDLNPLATQNVKRDLIVGFLGGFEELVGDRNISAQYSVEAVGSGTAGTAPAWGSQVQVCGFTETVTASTRVDYTLASDSFASATNAYHDSGVKHLSTGTRGTFDLRLELGERPMFDFSMLGLHNAEEAETNPTGVYTAFKTPQVVTNANSADIVLGCTHSTSGAPALASGTTYPSRGLRVSLGNQVEHSSLLGGESIEIAQREVTGSMTLELTAAQEVTLLASVRNATLTSIGFVHGTVVGRKFLVFMPYCQLTNPRKVEQNGKRLISFDFRCVPSAGNDELRLVTSF